MKNLLFALLLATVTTSYATDIFNFKLNENQKFESSCSVSFPDDATLHVVVVKNTETKKYDVLPFFMNNEGNIKEMGTASFEDKPDLLSSHKVGSTVSVLMYSRRNLTVTDFSLNNTMVITESLELRKRPDNIITQPNQSIVVVPGLNGKELEFILVGNSQSIKQKTTEVPKEYQRSIKNIFATNPDIINTDEFVQNGSIGNNQVYYENGNFIMITDENKDEQIEAFIVNPENDGSLTRKVFTTTAQLDKIKDGNSYLMDGKIFGMYLGKKDFGISVFDIETGEESKKFLLSEDISQIESARKTEEYMKSATKQRMRPTIAVNKTKNNNYSVIIDYVDATNYVYHNWMWMHQMMMMQQMMMLQQQQQTMIRAGGFGPNPTEYEIDEMFYEEQTNSLNITLDQDLNMLRDKSDPTKYQFVDKKKIMDNLKESKDFKNISAAFLENEYHYMYTDKQEETIYIRTKEIIRNY